ELCQLCRIPSFGANHEGMQQAAHFLQDLLERKGIRTELIEIEGAEPYVVGECGAGNRASVLWFNHYDIADYTNPVRWPRTAGEPEQFSGEVRGDRIYSRGVADDKATLLSRVHALEAFQAAHPGSPLTVRFLFEGKTSVDS